MRIGSQLGRFYSGTVCLSPKPRPISSRTDPCGTQAHAPFFHCKSRWHARPAVFRPLVHFVFDSFTNERPASSNAPILHGIEDPKLAIRTRLCARLRTGPGDGPEILDWSHNPPRFCTILCLLVIL
jgi:hypothetical protein